MLSRTCLGWTVCSETLELLQHEQWKVTHRVVKQVTRLFHHFGNSRVVEDCFGALADAERDCPNGKLSAVSIWDRPTRKGVLGKRNRYPEVQTTHIPAPCKREAQMPESMFKPAYKRTSCPLNDLPGVTSPDWPTCNATSWPARGAEVELMRFAHVHDCWGDLGQSWRAEFLQTGDVYLRHPEGNAYMVMERIARSVLVLWPMSPCSLKGNTAWQFADPTKERILYEPVLDFEKWRAAPTMATSPVAWFLLGRKTGALEASRSFVVQQGAPLPVLEHAAKRGFWQLSAASLRRLASSDFGDLILPADLPGMVQTLVEHILQCSTADAIDILELRGMASMGTNDNERTAMLDTEEAAIAMDAKSMEEAKALVESSKIAAKEASAFMDAVAKSRKRAAKQAPTASAILGSHSQTSASISVVIRPEFPSAIREQSSSFARGRTGDVATSSHTGVAESACASLQSRASSPCVCFPGRTLGVGLKFRLRLGTLDGRL